MKIEEVITIFQYAVRLILFSLCLIVLALFLFVFGPELEESLLVETEQEEVLQENPEFKLAAVDILKKDANQQLVINHCTACHSARLIVQNRATKEGWIATIRWMQATQNLWDLGDNESAIVEYLTKNYAPESKGRRANLQDVEWYQLED